MTVEQPLLMDINNSVFLDDGDTLVIIDRRYLPLKKVKVVACNYEEVASAIEAMAVQGAGDIAIAAGYGLYLAARAAERRHDQDKAEMGQFILSAQQRLIDTRPTGRYLAVLLNKMVANLGDDGGSWSAQLLDSVKTSIAKQQKRSELTGRWASQTIVSGDKLLTHCFPGAGLLYMLKWAREDGKNVEVLCTETRPYLQGARLTASAVAEMGFPVTLITDNMAAYCMSRKMITKVFTAADRIAMNGTIANKVGTFQLALAARYHQLPFYILGYGGPDKSCSDAGDICIEQRDPREVLTFNGVKISGEGVQGFYPAFDLTPAELITGIITDRGLISPDQVEQYWTLPV